MNDAASNEQHATINRRLRRLHRLTVASLCVNGLVLFLILIGAIIHHHRMACGNFGGYPRNMEERGGDHERFHGGFHRHHFEGREDWNRHENFDRPDPDRDEGPGPGRGFAHPEGPGPEANHDDGPSHGFGMMGAMHDPTQMTDMLLAHLTQQLALTDDQKAKIKPILQQQVFQFQKSMEDHRLAMQKQIEDAKAKLKPVLNADQQKQLDELPMPGQTPGPEKKPPGV